MHFERERNEKPKPVQRSNQKEEAIRTTPEEEQLKALEVFLLEKRDELSSCKERKRDYLALCCTHHNLLALQLPCLCETTCF